MADETDSTKVLELIAQELLRAQEDGLGSDLYQHQGVTQIYLTGSDLNAGCRSPRIFSVDTK